MKTAHPILTRFISISAGIWRRLQRRKRSNVQRKAYDCYAVFMSRELPHGKNLKP